MRIETYYFRPLITGGIKKQLLEVTEDKIGFSGNDFPFENLTDYSILFFNKHISSNPKVNFWTTRIELWTLGEKEPFIIEFDASMPSKMNPQQIQELHQYCHNYLWNSAGIRMYNEFRERLNKGEDIPVRKKMTLSRDAITIGKKGLFGGEPTTHKLTDVYFERYDNSLFYLKTKSNSKKIASFEFGQKNGLLYHTYIDFWSKK